MIDEIRRDIESRIRELLSEIEKLRRALAALTSREKLKPVATLSAEPEDVDRDGTPPAPATPPPRAARGRLHASAPDADARHAGVHSSGCNEGRGARRARWWRGDDGRGHREFHRAGARDGQHHAVQARAVG